MMMKTALSLLENGTDLSCEQAQSVFDTIFRGEANADELEAFLLALRRKGESLSELQGAVSAMRSVMKTIHAPENAMDIVGTGGDGHGTLNVSTAAAIVVAGDGIPVAKHGNRAATSRSGSSDVLRELGLNLEPSWDVIERSLNDIGLTFLFAPRHHPAMRTVAAVRSKIGVRTIFNLLGPLTNPAGVKRHLIGVFAPAWADPMARTLAALGSEAAWVSYGYQGLDEITTTGPTQISALKNGVVGSFTLTPEEAGLPLATLEDIKGGSPQENADAIRALLKGKKGPYRDIVLMNAGAALVVAGKVRELAHGIARAADSIDSGSAKDKLERLIALSNAA